MFNKERVEKKSNSCQNAGICQGITPTYSFEDGIIHGTLLILSRYYAQGLDLIKRCVAVALL